MTPDSTHTTRRQLLRRGAGGGAALAGTALVTSLHAGTAAAQTGDPLVGSWFLTIANAGGPGDLSLISFTADGIVITTSSPYSPPDPTQGSPASYSTQGQGSWKTTGTGTYHLTFMEITYDQTSAPQGTLTIAATVELATDGQSLTGSFGVHLALVDGTVLFDVPEPQGGTVRASRIPA